MTHSAETRPRRRLLRFAAIFLLGGLAALLGLRLVPATDEGLGPATVAVHAQAGGGETTVVVPPLGTITAGTHSAPLSLTLTVTEVDPERLGKAVSDPTSRAALQRTLESGLHRVARRLALQTLGAALIIGLLVGAVLPHRRASHFVAGMAGGVVLIGSLLALVATGFNVAAFQEPRFTGTLERAPQVIAAVNRSIESFDELQSRYTTAAERLSSLLTLVAEPLRSPQQNSVAILHISDVHSNPIGVEIASRLASEFEVDAVIDTGDITSFGAPDEALIGRVVRKIDVPYIFVPGNHDSTANRSALGREPNVTLLDRGAISVEGVDILGWADPRFTANNDVSTEESTDQIERSAALIGEAVAEGQPDVLAVHEAAMAADSIGEVPLVLAGHTHERSVEEEDGTLIMTVGSTGATGLGSFIVEGDRPYEAEIIYFRAGLAVAYDYVKLSGLGGDFEVERRTLEEAP